MTWGGQSKERMGRMCTCFTIKQNKYSVLPLCSLLGMSVLRATARYHSAKRVTKRETHHRKGQQKKNCVKTQIRKQKKTTLLLLPD